MKLKFNGEQGLLLERLRSRGTAIALDSSLWNKQVSVSFDENLTHLAGLAYGDGYPAWGEVRLVTGNDEFKEKLADIVSKVAREHNLSHRIYTREGSIAGTTQHNVILNSTLVRRALFSDDMLPKYDSIYSLAMDQGVAAHFQAGLSDAESSILDPVPIESPHGRIFAVINNDRRLLGITRLSLVNKLRLEPSSVRTRLASKKGRSHFVGGIEFVTRRNNYLIEILAGAKRKWLNQVGSLLWHPSKLEKAKRLSLTYVPSNDIANTTP